LVIYPERPCAPVFSPPGGRQRTKTLRGEQIMRKSYDFSHARRNPYAKRLKKAVTIRLQADIIDYFKAMSSETGIPYQNLINLYLLDCATEGRRLALEWRK
jgi:predicted DNA binding CopG/RHH family protein